jgi:hypothetical protein
VGYIMPLLPVAAGNLIIGGESFGVVKDLKKHLVHHCPSLRIYPKLQHRLLSS